MAVVSLVLEVRIAGCGTAKQTSQQTEAILGKLRRHFNVSVADLGGKGGGGTSLGIEAAVLGFAAVARSRREARDVLDRVADAVAAHPRVEILKVAFL